MTSIPEKDVKEIFALVERKAKKQGLNTTYQNTNTQLRVSNSPLNSADSAYMLVQKVINCNGFDVAYRVLFTVTGVCQAVEMGTKDMSNAEGFIEKAFEALQRDIDRREEIRVKRETERKELEILRKLIPVDFINSIGVGKNGDFYTVNMSTLTFNQAKNILSTL